MKKLALIGSLLLSANLAHGQATMCADVHDDITARSLRNEFLRSERDEGLKARMAILEMETIPLDLIAGKQSPKWLDFEKVQVITQSLRQAITEVRLNEGETGVQKFYQSLNQVSSRYSRMRELGLQLQIASARITYGPGDHGLRTAYRKEFEKLNHLLPSQLRFQLSPLPKDPNPDILKSQAHQIVKSIGPKLKALIGTSGYESTDALISTIRTHGNENVQKTLEMLLNEDVEFAIARPLNARWWVPKVGFHNQHVTGSSKGMNNPLGRDALEASRLSLTREEYEGNNNDLKPKYGWLLPSLKSGIPRKDVHYGEDYFILDKNKLRDRTTWTAGDSLNRSTVWIPRRDYGQAATPTHWDQLFLPWSERALLAPALQNFEKIQQFTPSGEDHKAIIGAEAPPLVFQRLGYEYAELQFWGPLTLDEVKAYVFLRTPPSGEFLAELQKRNIKIYEAVDSRTHKLWKPEGQK